MRVHSTAKHVSRSKRLFDLVAATILLLLGSPICLLVGLAIRWEDGGPALFRQVRVGRDGRRFTLYKLRSMRPDAEAHHGPQWAAIDDERATRIGRWIRALRIDEIPQAWNILRGEMSFVGPRPERPEFVRVLRARLPDYDRRHEVAPGLTGWAVVNQPYSGTIEDAAVKLRYDLEYVARASFLMDLRILARTARILLVGWGGIASSAARRSR